MEVELDDALRRMREVGKYVEDYLIKSDRVRAAKSFIEATNNSPELVEHLGEMCSIAAEVLGVDFCALTVLDDKVQYMVASSFPEVATNDVPVDKTMCKYTITNYNRYGDKFISTEIVDFLSNDLIEASGMCWYAGVPLEFGTKPIGALCTLNSKTLVFDEWKIEFMKSMSLAIQSIMDSLHAEG